MCVIARGYWGWVRGVDVGVKPHYLKLRAASRRHMAEQLLSSTIKPVKRSLTLPIYSIIDGTLNDSDSMSFMPKKFDYHR